MYPLVLLSLISLVTGAPLYPDTEHDIQKFCAGNPADIFFLLDSSSSIWSVNYRKQLKFLQNIVASFPISSSGTRIGVGIFSSRYIKTISFDDFDNVDDLKAKIGTTGHLLGSTHTGEALREVRKEFQRNARKNVARIAIVLTDGVSRNRDLTALEAQLLKDDDVYVFAIGIGKGPNMEELKAIGSTPSQEYVHSVAKFDLLDTIKEKLAMKVCRVPKYQAYCSAEIETDVMFAFDSSSMGTKNVRYAQNFISDVVGKFGNMAEGMIRTGVLSGFCHSNNINLDQYNNKEEMTIAVRNAEVQGLDQVVEELHRHSFDVSRGGRDSARKMAVLFIDQNVEKLDHIIIQSEVAKSKGIKVYVVAVGDVDEDALGTICSSPAEDHLMRVSSYDELDSLAEEYSEMFCEEMSYLPEY